MTRAGFEQAFPDGARLARYAASALAVPLRVEGQVTGAIGFPFNRPHAVDENVLSLAQIAAELGGQALQRSLAYERERSARDALERITRLVPRFVDAPEGAVVAAICEEAREMFDADVAQLWKAGDGRLKVIWRDPPDDRAPPGHVVEPRDYPGMQRSLERLDTTFFRDARTTVTGEALAARAGGGRPVRPPRAASSSRGGPSCSSRSAGRASSRIRRPSCSRWCAGSPTTPAS